jgi:hypothetical protein
MSRPRGLAGYWKKFFEEGVLGDPLDFTTPPERFSDDSESQQTSSVESKSRYSRFTENFVKNLAQELDSTGVFTTPTSSPAENSQTTKRKASSFHFMREDPFGMPIEHPLTKTVPTSQRVSFKDLATSATTVTVGSTAWFLSMTATLAITSGGFSGLTRSIKENPSAFAKGGLWMIPYNVLIANYTTEVQKQVQGSDHSALGFLKGGTAGVLAETVPGNIFDTMAIMSQLSQTKITQHLKTNPQFLEGLELQELQRLMPHSQANSKEALIGEIKAKPENILFSSSNLDFLRTKTGVRVSANDFARVNAAMFPASSVRNSYFYAVMAFANKSANEGNSLSVSDIALASAVGAAFTFIPNAATYQAADNAMKGMSSLQAARTALTEVVKNGVSSPTQGLALFGIRAITMAFTTWLLTADGQDKVAKTVDFLDQCLGGKTPKDIEKEAEIIAKDSTQQEQILEDYDKLMKTMDRFFKSAETPQTPMPKITGTTAKKAEEPVQKKSHEK